MNHATYFRNLMFVHVSDAEYSIFIESINWDGMIGGYVSLFAVTPGFCSTSSSELSCLG